MIGHVFLAQHTGTVSQRVVQQFIMYCKYYVYCL